MKGVRLAQLSRDVGRQKSEVRGQKSEDRSQRTEVRSQRTEVSLSLLIRPLLSFYGCAA